MKNEFKDKVALVTGGSYGIGRATAIAFAKKGAHVVIADVLENKETIEQIEAEGSKALFVNCNISKQNEVKNLIGLIIKRFGRLDFAFNNAGIEGNQAPTHECTEENWDKTMGVNLKGIWLCMKYEIEHMLKQGKGAIVNTSSAAGLIGFPGLPAYVATKHGVVGLTRTAALENAKQGIRVNAVCPGVIHTDMIDRLTGKDKEVEKTYIDMEPMGRMGLPEEVADVVVWLCSDQSSFVTGHALAVDGGLTAG